MSAFMVSDKHINTLVSCLRKWESLSRKEAQEYAEVLKKANIRSLDARYGKQLIDPKIEYRDIPEVMSETLPLVNILVACRCFEYQSCESNTWDDSYAKRIIDNIVNLTIENLPGFHDAPWGIE